MTNLSKELCEICGIEPVIEDNCKISDRYWKNSHKIKDIHDVYVQRYCPYNMECTSKCEYSYVKQIYPDFERPENFVKLFKLITTIENFSFRTGNFLYSSIPSYRQDSALTAGDEEYYASNPNPIQAFITCVIMHCQQDKDTVDYIRETEWIYE